MDEFDDIQMPLKKERYRLKKTIIVALIIILFILILLYLMNTTGMITDGGYTKPTTTISYNGSLLELINKTNNTHTTTTATTSTSVGGGGGGGGGSATTTIVTTTTMNNNATTTTTMTTTTTIFDNDTITVPNYTVKVNETIDVLVWLSTTRGAYGAQFNLSYNNSMLTVQNVTNGTFFAGTETYWLNYTMAGLITYAETRVNTTTDRVGLDVLSMIRFIATSNGNTTLNLYGIKVVNSSEEYLSLRTINGFVSVN